jgi:sugar phosphate isomerase/epimerase
MSTLTRRTFNQLALSSAATLAVPHAAQAKINSTFSGVTIGVQSYSYRDRPLDQAIAGMKEVGIGLCEMSQGHMEDRDDARESGGRERLRQWRLTVPLSEFEAAGQKFRDAGIDLYAYNYSFKDDFTDKEIERGFEMAKALGAKVITASANVATSKRIDQLAKRYKIRVGMHNHSRIRANEFATPADWDAARKGMSEYIAINLDIGHFVAAGFDPVDYLAKHHGDIVTLHIKDRKKDQGDNTPFGEGDTPIKEVLTLLREKKYAIPANIEYEYKGEDTIVEMKKCFAYCKNALGA